MDQMTAVSNDVTEKRYTAMIECASKISELLKQGASLPRGLEGDLDIIVRQLFSLSRSIGLPVKAQTQETLGVDLWNASIGRFDPSEDSRIGVLVRVFAFLLLDTAYQADTKESKDQHTQVRILKIALKTGRLCLDKSELALGLKVLERCADHVAAPCGQNGVAPASLSDAGKDSETYCMATQLEQEYYLLRIFHAWKTERHDLADHFLAKLDSRKLALTKEIAEKAADLFHHIAKEHFWANRLDVSVKWLEQGFTALGGCGHLEYLNPETMDLRFSISTLLVRVLLASGNSKSLQRARQIVDRFQRHPQLNENMSPYRLDLELTTAHELGQYDEIERLLMETVNSVALNEKNVHMIMRMINKASEFHCACRSALRELIVARLINETSLVAQEDRSMQRYLEKAVVQYILIAAARSQRLTNADVADLISLLDTVSEQAINAFSEEAAQAAQTLIWNVTNSVHSSAKQEWCQILRHPLFQSSGRLNQAQASRKIMAVALENGDVMSGLKAFEQLPTAAQNEPVCRCLAYKLALQSGDRDFAQECLDIVATSTGQDSAYLYACVFAAQQSNMRDSTLLALQKLLHRKPDGVHLQALLRCIACLLMGENRLPYESLEHFLDIVDVFEKAAESLGSKSSEPHKQVQNEIVWWSKISYNFAIRHSLELPPQELVRLLRVCTRLLDSGGQDGELSDKDDFGKRKLICHFLSATALIMLARSVETDSIQIYREAQEQIQGFDAAQAQLSHHKTDSRETQRIFEMRKFDLECLLKLQQWHRLEGLLRSCLDLAHIERWDSLADLLFIMHEDITAQAASDSPASTIVIDALQTIINETWRCDRDIVKVSRWLRQTFALCLGAGDRGDRGFSFKLLQQAEAMAAGGRSGRYAAYPQDELYWLATTSFNHSLDSLAHGRRDTALAWCEGAMALAKHIEDAGALYDMLRRNRDVALKRFGDRM